MYELERQEPIFSGSRKGEGNTNDYMTTVLTLVM